MTRMFAWTAVAAALMVSVVVAEELKSGLQPGDSPGAFNVNDVTGPKAGTSLCYRCQAGARPVVCIFTRKIDDNVASLIKNIDGQVEANKDAQLRSFVVLLTDDPDGAEKQLKEVASKNNIKNVPLTTFDGKAGPPDYKLSEKAETTVLLWNKSKVEVNHAFEAGKLNKDSVAAIAKDTAKILPAK